MLLAGVANAQNLTVWLEPADDPGGNYIEMLPSETAVINLMMTVPAGMQLVNVDAMLLHYDYAYGKDVSFEIVDFSDHGPYGEDLDHPGDDAFGRTTRGKSGGVPIEELLPWPGVEGYQYVGEDANLNPVPNIWDGYSGVFGPGTYILDDIVIHCTGPSLDGLPDMIFFGFGDQAPAAVEVLFAPAPPPGQWYSSDVSVVDLGIGATWDDPLLIMNVPEPATLGLLLLGGLAAFRRR